MTLDEAFEEIGDLISQASGQGYDAFERIKEAVADQRHALTRALYVIDEHAGRVKAREIIEGALKATDA